MSLSKNNNHIFKDANLKVVNITNNKYTACWNYDYVRIKEHGRRYVRSDHSGPFLGTFVKMKKATITFVMSVHLSNRIEQVGCRCSDFNNKDVWEFFENLSRKFKIRHLGAGIFF
jgi:hypothetical protein